MSDTVLLALIAAIASTVATLGVAIIGLVVSLRNGKKADDNAIKTAEIHTATNGNLSELRKVNEVAMQEIKGLKDLIAEKDIVKQEAQKKESKAERKPK